MSPRSGKGVRTQFQGRASQILLIKDYHLTSIKAKIPINLCMHTTSKQKKIEDHNWRHFEEHIKFFLFNLNFI